jgi:hypothetical protein
MTEFLALACPNLYETTAYPAELEDTYPKFEDYDNPLDWLYDCTDWESANTKTVLMPITPKVYKMKEKNFCVHCSDLFVDGEDTVHFGYNYECLFSNSPRGAVVILRDMAQRGKHMKGFSRITKILLHEIGHLATYTKVHNKYSTDELVELHHHCRNNYNYIRLPDEYAATQWAIDWLKDANNRKTAKQFEKKFWACFVAE